VKRNVMPRGLLQRVAGVLSALLLISVACQQEPGVGGPSLGQVVSARQENLSAADANQSQPILSQEATASEGMVWIPQGNLYNMGHARGGPDEQPDEDRTVKIHQPTKKRGRWSLAIVPNWV